MSNAHILLSWSDVSKYVGYTLLDELYIGILCHSGGI